MARKTLISNPPIRPKRKSVGGSAALEAYNRNMAAVFDPRALPSQVRLLLARALETGEGHDDAVAKLEQALAEGVDREPNILAALALMTYEAAATGGRGSLGGAAERALRLIDEALATGREVPRDLRRLQVLCAAALEQERARERRLRGLLSNLDQARPTELAELAHRIVMSGEDDALAAELMRRAAERASGGE